MFSDNLAALRLTASFPFACSSCFHGALIWACIQKKVSQIDEALPLDDGGEKNSTGDLP